jgi:hypothetical protein
MRLSNIRGKGKVKMPKQSTEFDLVVIRPQEFSTESDESWRDYLKASLPDEAMKEMGAN